jgi:anti-sigma-K factor RskA
MVVTAALATGWKTSHIVGFLNLRERREARRTAAADRDRLVARYERRLRELRGE